MLDLSGVDLARDSGAAVAVRKPLPVSVSFAERPGVVQTLEGPVRHEAGAAICTGRRGERWPVERSVFDATYEAVAGTVPGSDGEYLPRPLRVLARQIRVKFATGTVPGGQRIRGQPGDWLVQYSSGRHGIVADEVFRLIYDTALAVSSGTDAPSGQRPVVASDRRMDPATFLMLQGDLLSAIDAACLKPAKSQRTIVWIAYWLSPFAVLFAAVQLASYEGWVVRQQLGLRYSSLQRCWSPTSSRAASGG